MPVPSSAPPTRADSRFVWAWLATVALVAGALFPLLTVVILNWFNNPGPFWIDQLYQRKLRSLAARPASKGPRLLIFGGSASLFGVDAEWIEKELRIPTVNFATHAGLGLDYQISRIERTAEKGDSVLFCPELEAYVESDTPTDVLREYAFSHDKRYLFSLTPTVALSSFFLTPPKDYLDSIARWNDRLTGKDEPDPSEIRHRHSYSLLQLSPNGDMRDLALTRDPVPQGFPTTFTAHAMKSLAAANRWCRQHHVRLLLAWANHVTPPPPVQKSDFVMYDMVAQFCKEQGIHIVGPPEESLYPKELFIDSIYHLNEIGRRIHTEKLISRLRGIFNIQPPEGAKTVCVLGARTPLVNETGIFGKQESVDYKYLTDVPLGRQDCITPGALRDLALSGVRVVCIDDATEAIAQNAGLTSREIRRREESFADWVQRYNHHLFLLALVGMDHCPVTLESPAKYFARFLSEPGFRVGLFGTGPFKAIHHLASGPDAAKWRKRLYEPLAPPPAFNFGIMLRSGPLPSFDKENPAILVEGERLSEPTAGLAVAVIDPELGTVVARATFQGERLLEWKLRELVIP
jgi:hypothetical protein